MTRDRLIEAVRKLKQNDVRWLEDQARTPRRAESLGFRLGKLLGEVAIDAKSFWASTSPAARASLVLSGPALVTVIAAVIATLGRETSQPETAKVAVEGTTAPSGAAGSAMQGTPPRPVEVMAACYSYYQGDLSDRCICADAGTPLLGWGKYVGSVVDGCVYVDSGYSVAGYGRHIGSVKNGLIYQHGGVPIAGAGTYVGSVKDGLIFRDSGYPLAGYGRYMGSVKNGYVFKDRGYPLLGYGTYVGSGKNLPREELAAAALLLGLVE